MTKKLTPMMQQYMEVRESLPEDTQLLFRLGDFYEMFENKKKIYFYCSCITLINLHLFIFIYFILTIGKPSCCQVEIPPCKT